MTKKKDSESTVRERKACQLLLEPLEILFNRKNKGLLEMAGLQLLLSKI